MHKNSYAITKESLQLNISSLQRVLENLTEAEVVQVEEILNQLILNGGRLHFTGVGKSGFIAQKLASTFLSLGHPANFLHPTEAMHGDLGGIRKNDAIVLISKSGSTKEILDFLPYLNIPAEKRIGLLGKKASALSEHCHVVLDCSVEKEACKNNQAPTTSTVVAMAMGDALGVLYQHLVGLTQEGFAQNHPGGLLGKMLGLKVESVMISKKDCCMVDFDTPLREILLKMTERPLGMCCICENDELKGIIVEGDIRRSLLENEAALDLKAKDLMGTEYISVHPQKLAIEALRTMERRDRPVSVVPIIEEGVFKGILRLHDLLKAGL